MRGVWYTTGSTAIGVAVIYVLAAAAGVEAAAWLLARIWWILAALAACAILASWAALRLGRYNDRHAAALWAQRSVQLRAEVIPPSVPAPPQPQAIEHHHHGPEFHIYGADGQEAAARLIRRALTEGNDRDHRHRRYRCASGEQDEDVFTVIAAALTPRAETS